MALCCWECAIPLDDWDDDEDDLVEALTVQLGVICAACAGAESEVAEEPRAA